jgi:hypothetical protein
MIIIEDAAKMGMDGHLADTKLLVAQPFLPANNIKHGIEAIEANGRRICPVLVLTSAAWGRAKRGRAISRVVCAAGFPLMA